MNEKELSDAIEQINKKYFATRETITTMTDTTFNLYSQLVYQLTEEIKHKDEEIKKLNAQINTPKAGQKKY